MLVDTSKKSGLLGSRTTFKPMTYPWAFEGYKTQQHAHWIPEEVPLHADVSDYERRLNEKQKNLIVQIFRFFTQGDVDVGNAYTSVYIPAFGGHPEVRMMLTAIGSIEAVHVEAYSLLLETLGLPETEYQAFAEIDEMSAKHNFYESEAFKGQDLESMAKAMAVFSAFTEGLHLFSSFAILLNFPRNNLLKGMGQIITWSVRDESLHVELMLKLFRTFIDENPQIWTEKLRQELYDIARHMVELEDNFIDRAFELGGTDGLEAEDVKAYVRWLADLRLGQLGLEAIYGTEGEPCPLEWLPAMLNAVEHTNFFENRATEYSKAAMSGSWASVWSTVDDLNPIAEAS